LRRGDFEVGDHGWNSDYNDAQDFLFLWQTSTKQENFARFSNPDYDRLMDEASVTSDEGKRAQLLARAEQILLQELPVLPYYFRVSKNLVSTPGVQTIEKAGPMGLAIMEGRNGTVRRTGCLTKE
jgi:oligopeptide transport system substrate-binding protein